MKHTIEQTIDGVQINAAVPIEKQKPLLEEFSKCAAGTCSCPTPQYEKVASMNVTANESGVTVNLKLKDGETIDVADIERCLEHTAKTIESQT